MHSGGVSGPYQSGRQIRSACGISSPRHLVAMSSFSRASAQKRSLQSGQSSRCHSRVSHIGGDNSPSISAHSRARTTTHLGSTGGVSGGRSFISSVSDDAAVGRLYFSQAEQCNRRRRKKLPTDCRCNPLSFRKLKSERLFGYLARRSGNRAPPHGAPGEEPAREFVQAVDARGWRRQKRPR